MPQPYLRENAPCLEYEKFDVEKYNFFKSGENILLCIFTLRGKILIMIEDIDIEEILNDSGADIFLTMNGCPREAARKEYIPTISFQSWETMHASYLNICVTLQKIP